MYMFPPFFLHVTTDVPALSASRQPTHHSRRAQSKVTCFHLDEYVGIDITHGASFRKYLQERFVDKLTVKPAVFHYVDGSGDDPKVRNVT